MGVPLPMTMPEQFGRYQLHGLLGHGAAGEVYDAFDPSAGCRVAIKILPPALLEGPEGVERRTRFLAGAEAMRRLIHPGIVAVREHGCQEDGTPYIVMERVRGRTLREVMRLHMRFTLTSVVRVNLRLLDPLAYLHAQGLVHLDLKPANLLLLPGWRVKIADFGLARYREPGRIPAGATVAGTLGYMAPEQLMGSEPDPRTDLFAVGVILYELLTGVKPFRGHTRGELIQRVLHHDPSPPSRHAPGLPPAWDELVQRALAKRPGKRFQSAPDLAAALSDLRGVLP